MALLMLPRVVLTHLKAGFRAALRPDPEMIGWWTHPALPTPAKQRRPSLTTVLAGLKLRFAKVTISARRKPFTRRNCKRIGFPCGVVSTAATIGVLPGEPRPRLPPFRSPPRSASSTSIRPVRRFVASRSIITCMSLCLIFQAVVWVTPSRRPNSILEMPPLLCVRWYMARNQVHSGTLVAAKIVPAITDSEAAGQPTVPVAIELEAEWTPSRHPQIDQAQLGVHEVEVVM